MKITALAALGVVTGAVALLTGSASATHVRPKAASPIYVSIVPAYAPCTAPNRVHAAPLSYSSCSPPAQASSYVSAGTPDANGAAASSIGFVKLVVTNGPGASDADVTVTASVTDVRCSGSFACGAANAAAGPDYTGTLAAVAALTITDHQNADPSVPGDPFDDPATSAEQQDLFQAFNVVIFCTSTSSTAVGATCSSTTTVNAIVPGAISEMKRSVWELGRWRVADGGSDGNVSTTPNEEFGAGGIFIP